MFESSRNQASTILEEEYPGVILAGSSPRQSNKMNSIPHAGLSRNKKELNNLSLGGEGIQLKDPQFKVVNQERAANFILE